MNPRPLIFLHGWGSQPSVFDTVRAVIGLPSESPALSADFESIEDWADAIAADISTRHQPPVLLVGWSQGAQLALCIAARHPKLVAGLVLIAATPRFVSSPDWAQGLDADTVAAFRQGFLNNPSRIRQRFIVLQSLGDDMGRDLVAALESHAADPVDNHAALAKGLQLLAETDLRANLPSPALPAVFIHGTNDALMPLAAIDFMVKRWHASSTVILPNCGHAPHLSQTAAVASAIGGLVERLG